MTPEFKAKPADLTTVDAARKALSVFFRISAEWGLNSAQEQQILGVSRTTFFNWKRGDVKASLENWVLERLSYVLRIYGALQILLPIPERAASWIKAANAAPLFGGSSALDRMLGGQAGDLKVVADYLDCQRGGDFA